MDPVTLTTSAVSIIGKIESFLGIGGGRREADQITPIQNEIHFDVLAPISAALDSSIEPTYSELQTMYRTLVDTESKWLAFLRNTQWDDGRAAVQAEATLQPYFSEFKAEILQRLSGMTGGVIPGDIIGDWFPSPTVNIPGLDPRLPTLPGQTPVYTPTQAAAIPWWVPAAVVGGLLFLGTKKSRRV